MHKAADKRGLLLTLKQGIFFLLAGMLVSTGMPVFGSAYTMKGPPLSTPVISPENQFQPVAASQNLLLKAIHFYRSVISPAQGGRCGFYPSCSTFGLHAVQHYGALQGVMMTTDRLTRCNIFKKPDADYYLRPDGRLNDPVEANLLKTR